LVLPDEGVVYQQGYCGIVSYPPAARKPTEPPYYCHCFIWIKAERLPLCRWQEHTALVDCWINGNCADQFRVHGPFQLTPATHCSTIDSSTSKAQQHESARRKWFVSAFAKRELQIDPLQDDSLSAGASRCTSELLHRVALCWMRQHILVGLPIVMDFDMDQGDSLNYTITVFVTKPSAPLYCLDVVTLVPRILQPDVPLPLQLCNSS